MTEAHGHRRGHLAEQIDREHQGNRLKEALEIAPHTVGSDLGILHQHEGHEAPAEGGVEISRYRPQPQQTDETAEAGERKDRGNIGGKAAEFLPHAAFHQVFHGFHQHFCDHLPLADCPDLHIMRQKQDQPQQHQHDNPAHNNGFGQIYCQINPGNGKGRNDLRSVYLNLLDACQKI